MIKQLPSQIANLIAAGEVVQRPSSVVKELMENSVDAGATKIEVVIRDSGRTLIQVIDNGSGLSLSDAKKAFLRHATSKISKAEDLHSIATYGFRGEALASISSVAQVTLRTRRAKDEVAAKLIFAESTLVAETQVAAPIGSNFEVRNLFYNVPARRKFLKSNATEFRHITYEFTRVALTRPEITFELYHNGELLYSLPTATLKKRIQDVIVGDMGREVVEIALETPIAKISGYVGKPQQARKSPGNQYFFVNERYFRSAYFHKAVMKGYEGLIAPDTLPSYFIYFEVDPSKVDVNIHPSKVEVKFEDDYALFDFLTSAVRESLAKNSFMPSIDFDQEGAPEMPKVKMSGYVAPPKVNYDPLFNPFDQERGGERGSSLVLEGVTRSGDAFEGVSRGERFEGGISRGGGSGDAIFGDQLESFIGVTPPLQLVGKYVVTTLKSALLIIHIGRATERILYERYLAQLLSNINITQKLLFPSSCDISDSDRLLLEEEMESLRSGGFDLKLEEGRVEINGIPDGFDELLEEPERLIDLLVSELQEGGKDFEKEGQEAIAFRLSKLGRRGRRGALSSIEAQALIDSLFACREPTFTADGRSCFTTVGEEELERWFARLN